MSIENAWERTKGENFLRTVEQINHPIRRMIVKRGIGKTVLDVGCASCIDYPDWRDAGFDYTGLDFTKKFMGRARELHPEIQLTTADASEIPLPDKSIDTVYCKDLLEHLPPEKYIAVIREMWRVTKSRMIIAFYITPREMPTRYVLADNLHYRNEYSKNDAMAVLNSLEGAKVTEVIEGIGFNNSALYVVDGI